MMDLILEAWVSSLIEMSKLAWILGRGRAWRPGEKLKLLFAGYNGNRNTGSDVRVEEMLRQIGHILGPERVEFTVMSHNLELSAGYFQAARQIKLPDIFPAFLFAEVPKHDGLIACEGSMFKSKFANALSAMMIGSLGIAAAHNKLSVGYGSEAGEMDAFLANMCARYCQQSLIVTRNEESRTVLRELGVPTELGTDTAWTFEPMSPEYARKTLRELGWDGQTLLLAICPINPFEWPVKASLAKFLAHQLTGGYEASHYRSLYFHNSGPRAERSYQQYLNAIARAVDAFRRDNKIFPLLVAMERLDARPCRHISERLGGLPIVTSETYNMYQLVSILRMCSMMVSSRYHAIVTSMPAQVPSAGITMDERIRNLMRERSHHDLLMNVDDPDLEPKLVAALNKLRSEREGIADGIGRTVVKNLKLMARMGVYFEEEVERRYPEFPTRRGEYSWEDYLPPLGSNLRRLLDRYETARTDEPSMVAD